MSLQRAADGGQGLDFGPFENKKALRGQRFDEGCRRRCNRAASAPCSRSVDGPIRKGLQLWWTFEALTRERLSRWRALPVELTHSVSVGDWRRIT